MVAQAEQILRQYWGHERFYPGQKQVIEAVLSGIDVLALMPTGGGKSVCYQVPALLLQGVTLVISPLIALMEDQIKALKVKGIAASYINSSLDASEITRVLEDAQSGRLKMLYITPERIQTESFLRAVPYMNLSLVAVDEAHCISQWGHDFRPSYKHIGLLRKYTRAPFVALTATATEQVCTDIAKNLQFSSEARTVTTSFLRENLSYRVVKTPSKYPKLLTLLQEGETSAIVYCGLRLDIDKLVKFLQGNGISAVPYHAGMLPYLRKKSQNAWLQGESRVMVATNAFGMGIDKADVGQVIHWYVPLSPEDYFQEAGRAGRDGKPARAVILYDEPTLRRMHQWSQAVQQPEQVADLYQKLCDHYGIGQGEVSDKMYPFSLPEFSEKHRMDAFEVRSALSILARTDLVNFYGSEQMRSKVWIKISPREVFDYHEGRLCDVLEALLRSVEGICSFLCDIDEAALAAKVEMSVDDFKDALRTLSLRGEIDYIAAHTYQWMNFPLVREDRYALGLLKKMLSFSKERKGQRAAAMFEYLNLTGCRSQWMQRYFGETSSKDCGICDNCAPQKEFVFEKQQGSDGQIRDFLLEVLRSKPMSVQQIASMTNLPAKKIIPVLKELLESGMVCFDGVENFSLRLPDQ